VDSHERYKCSRLDDRESWGASMDVTFGAQPKRNHIFCGSKRVLDMFREISVGATIKIVVAQPDWRWLRYELRARISPITALRTCVCSFLASSNLRVTQARKLFVLTREPGPG